MEKYSKTNFGIRDLSKKNHWSSNVKNFQITKPTYICFGGNGTTDSQKANFQASRVERLMGLKPYDDHIFGTYKNIDVIAFYLGKNKESDQVGTMSNEECFNIVNNLFLPLCVNKNTNTKLPLKEACKNFSNVIFSSFCYGSECVNDLMYELQKQLLKLGYTQDEVQQIYSHAFHLAYSPYKADEFLPFMQICSFEDSFNKTFDMDIWFEKKFGYHLNGVKVHYDKKYFYNYIMDKFLKPNQKEVSVYTSKLVNTKENRGEKTLDEHNSMFIDLDENWNASKISNRAKNSECVSKIAGNALAMAGARALNIIRNKKNIEPINLKLLAEAADSILEGYSEEDLQME